MCDRATGNDARIETVEAASKSLGRGPGAQVSAMRWRSIPAAAFTVCAATTQGYWIGARRTNGALRACMAVRGISWTILSPLLWIVMCGSHAFHRLSPWHRVWCTGAAASVHVWTRHDRWYVYDLTGFPVGTRKAAALRRHVVQQATAAGVPLVFKAANPSLAALYEQDGATRTGAATRSGRVPMIIPPQGR